MCMDKTELQAIIAKALPDPDTTVYWEATESPDIKEVLLIARKRLTIGVLQPIDVVITSKTGNEETQIILCVQHINNEILSKI